MPPQRPARQRAASLEQPRGVAEQPSAARQPAQPRRLHGAVARRPALLASPLARNRRARRRCAAEQLRIRARAASTPPPPLERARCGCGSLSARDHIVDEACAPPTAWTRRQQPMSPPRPTGLTLVARGDSAAERKSLPRGQVLAATCVFTTPKTPRFREAFLPPTRLTSKVGILKNASKRAFRAVCLRLGDGQGSGWSGSTACHPNESRLPYERIASVYERLQRDSLFNPEGAVSVRSAHHLG